MRWCEGFDLIDRDLIVPHYLKIDVPIDFANALSEVVGERIVVVDDQDHK